MNQRIKALIVGLGILLLFSACKSGGTLELSKTPDLYGTWNFTEELPGGYGYFLDWQFNEDGTFTMVGYPPITQSGKYEFNKIEGEDVELRLFERKGDLGTEDRMLKIQINSNGTILIDGQGPYSKK